MSDKKEIVIKNYDIAKVSEVTTMANTLKSHIVKNKLYTAIRNKNYVEVEGWQFAGGMLGVLPRVVSVENMSTEDEIKYIAQVELVNIATDKIVGRGFALCSGNELKNGKKVRTDEYAIMSMAQTRAIGKAYRSVIGWVMKMAGYEGTPSEEVVEFDEAKIQKLEKHEEAVSKIIDLKELIKYYKANEGDGKEFAKLVTARKKELQNEKA